MSRDLDAVVDGAIERPVVRPALALHIALPDPVYVWTGLGTLTFPDLDNVDREWIGAGGLGAIDAVDESTDGSATGLRLTLFDVPSQFRDDIADQATRGAEVDLYVIVLNETFQRVEGVQRLNRWRLDTYRINDSGTSLGVEITAESRAIDQKRPSIKRFTDEYQQRQHPGDLFFQYVPQMAEVSILWAKAEPKMTGLGGGVSGAALRMVKSL